MRHDSTNVMTKKVDRYVQPCIISVLLQGDAKNLNAALEIIDM